MVWAITCTSEKLASLAVDSVASIAFALRPADARQAIGDDVDTVCVDISKIADIESLRAHVEGKHGRVDIIFANAGGGRPGLFEPMSEEDFDFTVNTNFKGTYFTVQKLLPLMTGGGSVILNTSTLGKQGRPFTSVYSATKAAIRSLARTLTGELSEKGIRVNAMAPGLMDTDLARKTGMSEEMIKQANAQAHAVIPMHRSGTADEIAKAVLFLASDESTYVTGIELCVDGLAPHSSSVAAVDAWRASRIQ
ncbi:SDR family oxidoreductase [Bradyrhizobium sp. Cp5.3]|uniref:SDR family oxidoreductase n=1 Tax=Bradyrhizobium sp. Cp5.3 TaxID=443598 RepID=UPI0009FC1930|nr:SDR family oxidoreductase [Bradyrhizobium sp. Cp5.3]